MHCTMKPDEGGEGEVPVAASVQQVSAGGRRESMAAHDLSLILPSLISVSLPPTLGPFHCA